MVLRGYSEQKVIASDPDTKRMWLQDQRNLMIEKAVQRINILLDNKLITVSEAEDLDPWLHEGANALCWRAWNAR